ncbi:MAG: Abortive infection protein [Bryobacterales bacterium]|nr:Abortive infection protein [Bryobacterales bacterium]
MLCAAAGVYGGDGSIPTWVGIPFIAAFLLEFAFYLVPGFEAVRAALTTRFSKAALAPLLVASAVAPYLIYSTGTGQFRWTALFTLLGIACAVSYWFVVFKGSIASDIGFLGLLVAVVLAKVFKQIYVPAIPHMEIHVRGLAVRVPPDLLGHLMIIRLGASALLMQRRFEGLRFGFIPSLKESIVGFRFFVYFLPVGAALGWWLGIGLHGVAGPAWKAIGVFFGVLWVVALSEEFVFRGILQDGLARVTGSPVGALLIASLIFGLCHLPFGGFPNWRMAAIATVAGVFYGQAFRVGGVRASMVSHALVVTTWLVWLK